VFAKALGIVGAILVGVAAVIKFLDQRQLDLLKTSMELERPREEARSAVFNRAIKATQTIATSSKLDAPGVPEAIAIFWQLYWGELAIYEGKDVAAAMVAFGLALQRWQKENVKKKPEKSEERSPEMGQLSLDLAKACNKELKDESDARLRALEDKFNSLLKEVAAFSSVEFGPCERRNPPQSHLTRAAIPL
jgi:hypothetical protein